MRKRALIGPEVIMGRSRSRDLFSEAALFDETLGP